MSKFRYFKETHNAAFALAAVAPLLLLYEAGIVLYFRRLNPESQIEIRNAAEVFLKNILAMVGMSSNWVQVSLYFVMTGFVIILHKRRHGSLHLRHLGICLIESLVYATFLGYLAKEFTRFILSLQAGWQQQAIGMMPDLLQAIGAGIYEELLFRLIMMGSLLILFRQLLPDKIGIQAAIALIVSSLIFAVFHYVSWESVTWQSFFFRFFAGLILGVIFLTRNFAVAVYTHAFYDILFWLQGRF